MITLRTLEGKGVVKRWCCAVDWYTRSACSQYMHVLTNANVLKEATLYMHVHLLD